MEETSTASLGLDDLPIWSKRQRLWPPYGQWPKIGTEQYLEVMKDVVKPCMDSTTLMAIMYGNRTPHLPIKPRKLTRGVRAS
ncbi:Hypothetical protein FKW44_000251 [Caligus rogercresseyi]|uniref:Uncharacterized protein n=1 Tax=Caligus rogercresseyi TaxID=217165 RepID=A0A7T8QUS0_CALRO|nr:Hypothetical protein FKW44_000251 [Caligus rogercresseyi]